VVFQPEVFARALPCSCCQPKLLVSHQELPATIYVVCLLFVVSGLKS